MLAMKTVRGAGLLMMSRLLGRLVDFVTLLILARTLTPADFGLAALALSLVMIVDMVLEVPVTQALVRLPTIDDGHLDTGFTLGLLRGLAVALVLALAAWPYAAINHDPQLASLVLVLACAPIARGLTSPRLVVFIRDLGFGRTFVMELSGKVVAFACALSALWAGAGYWALIVNFVAGPVFSCALSYVLAPYRPSWSLEKRADFIGFVGWFSLSQIVSALNWQFDRLLIGLFGTRDMLGRYAVASDLSVIATQSIIGPALQPVMSAFSRIATDRVRLRQAFLKAARFSMLISVPISLGIALTSDLAVAVLLGPQWREAAPLLSLLALSVVPTPYQQTFSALAMSMDRPQLIFRLNTLDLVLRCSLVAAGFWAGSVAGVAAGRVVASLLVGAAYFLTVARTVDIGVATQLRNLWKVAFAGAAMSLVTLLLRDWLLRWHPSVLVELAVVATVGAAVYAAALLATGVRLSLGAGRLELVDRWWR